MSKIGTIGNLVIAGVMGINSAQANVEQNNQINETLGTFKTEIQKNIGTSDTKDIENILLLNEVFKKKSAEIEYYLTNYGENQENKYLAKMPENDFQELINIVYYDQNNLIKDEKNSSIDSIISINTKKIEHYFDELFEIMMSQGESDRAFIYMGYLNKEFGYSYKNLSKKYFSFENIPEGILKQNLNQIINNLKSNQNNLKYIKSLQIIDFIGKEGYNSLNSYDMKVLKPYIEIIKEKIIDLYINETNYEGTQNSNYGNA